ncbi:MAG: tRNA lysidine(34) synthetase TilS [Deltaproteobacteria bacterium]|nr:tRNA lysidine(34) synthetase TilS [Deltaproteobacteria bacterium]
MLVARVLRTIEAHALLDPGARVLVAISGGADSLALLHALRSIAGDLGLVLTGATVDHGLRPESADEHAKVASYVRSTGVPCEVLGLSLGAGNAIQERARDARYEALLRHASEEGCDAVAVAHTRDDQAETVLARLLRGAGVRGLAGALRRRDDRVVRPMLDVSRAEILAYLGDLGLTPLVDDPSNRDDRFLRSRVRHGLLPTLAAEQPEIASMLARLADDAREHREMVEGLADELEPLASPSLAVLARARPPLRRELLRRWGVRQGLAPLGRVHLEALERLCLTARGEARLPGAFVVAIENGRLALRPIHDPRPSPPTQSDSVEEA